MALKPVLVVVVVVVVVVEMLRRLRSGLEWVLDPKLWPEFAPKVPGL